MIRRNFCQSAFPPGMLRARKAEKLRALNEREREAVYRAETIPTGATLRRADAHSHGKGTTMSHQGPAHRSIVWSKQKLDELDALITELDASADRLKDSAKAEANKALDRIRASREAFRTYVADAEAEVADAARTGVSRARHATGEARADIEKEWVEAELAFQSFLSAAADDAGVARKALAARAKAEREALEASLDRFGDETTEAIEAARKDFDSALNRLSKEADKAGSEAGKVSAAGAESWQAIREGLKEAHAVHVRTARKVAEAFDRLR